MMSDLMGIWDPEIVVWDICPIWQIIIKICLKSRAEAL